MGVFKDLIGTSRALFRLGLKGPHIKGEAGGDVSARNLADDAYAAIRAALFKTFGDDFELNAGAAGAGADWKFTLSRPSTGMTHALQVIFPAADPAPGQALTVASLAGDVITLAWSTVAGGTDKVVTDTTTLAYDTASPAAMFAKPANAVVKLITVVVDEPFDGAAPAASVGIAGTTSKYLGSTDIDLTAPAGTVFEVSPGLEAEAGVENLIATLNADGSTAGSARILVDYVIPS